MKKMVFLTCFAIAFSIATNASASESEGVTPYLGVSYTNFGMDLGTQPSGFSGFEEKLRASGYMIKAGVDFYKYYGVEVRFGASGDARTTGNVLGGPVVMGNPLDVTINLALKNMTSVFLKLQKTVADKVTILGYIGSSSATTEVKAYVGSTQIANYSESTSSGSVGIGASYDIGEQGALEIEYMKYSSDVSGLSLGVTTKF